MNTDRQPATAPGSRASTGRSAIPGNRFLLPASLLLQAAISSAQTNPIRVSGSVLDPSGRSIAGAHVRVASPSGSQAAATTGSDGSFALTLPSAGPYSVQVDASGFTEITRKLMLNAQAATLDLRLATVSAADQLVIVTANVSDIDLASPDPSQKVMVREELLDANPGRPGAPIAIPGLPIETASGGIKAPQYFAPGVAGDHGEPIAQYLSVGSFLVPNNLSANAHGNGYADPNIYISSALGSVSTDAGAFNVLEGNHALNLSATYGLRPRLQRFLTLTGDYRDIDATLGLAPANTEKKRWLALEGNFGNGLLRRLEHRQQYKLNAFQVLDPGNHEITLFADAYYGVSHEGNLVPIGSGVQVHDTVDLRQMDQTHTALFAANDNWTPTNQDSLSLSGFARTFNLTLFSDFGEGLIRQSEFRTVEGAEARATHQFASWLEATAGLLYNEDDIRNDNLDHFLSPVASTYGSFAKVLSNNITIREFAPYAAVHGELGRHLQFYAGIRNDQVQFINADKVQAAYSFNEWRSFQSPKATLTWSPGTGLTRWLPSASFSLGQAFFTEDPRINLAHSATALGGAAFTNPFERSHAYQLVLEKIFGNTDARLTLSRTTETATLAKIDPDNGSSQDLGPSTIKFLTVNVRHQFSFGTLQGVVSKADARLSTVDGLPGTVTPEAPRTIFDVLTTFDKLPLGLHGRAEYEYVGHKFLDVGNLDHPDQYEAVPVNETRVALVKTLANGRLELGANALVAHGYTGQTTETFNPEWSIATSQTNLPYCAPGSGPSGQANDFDCGTVERAVGVRMVSFIGGSVSWRFHSTR